MGNIRTCRVCIFLDVCDGKKVCEYFYADGCEDWYDEDEEKKNKIEYLEAWEAYTSGFQ